MRFYQPSSKLTYVTLAAVLLLFAGLFPAIMPTWAAIDSADDAITYQGRLTDAGGSPLNGEQSMQFRLFRSATGGTAIWSSGMLPVSVDDGLFTVDLAVNQADLDGRLVWLEIRVGDEVLNPRQPLRPAPLALSLRPGAVIRGAEPLAPALTVRQVATGTALRLESQDTGVHAAGEIFGVRGEHSGSTLGYGGHFTSATGVGVYGMSSAPSTGANLYAPGVWGESERGVGVMGVGTGASATIGVFGRAATGFGVYADAAGVGVLGQSSGIGIYGLGNAGSQGSGYGGYFASSTGAGVHGRSTAQMTTQNLYAPGVWGYSERGAAVFGQQGNQPSALAGFFDGRVVIVGDLSVIGDLSVTNGKEGYVVDIALNDGPEALLPHDVVIITGVADPVVGSIPVPRVRRADQPHDTRVAGVVERLYVLDDAGQTQSANEAIAPGEYLSLVTLGAYGAIRVDADYGAIAPGDLLVTSPTPGHAMRADAPGVGTVIGKALDSHSSGTGSIPVLVSLQ